MMISISKSLIRAICQSRNSFSVSARKLIDSPRYFVRLMGSATHRKALGQEPRQTSLRDFLLRGWQIVFQAQQLDKLVFYIVNAICCVPVAVTRLPDAAGVNEIFFCGLDANVLGSLAPNAFGAHEYHRHMGVAEETNGRALISETRDGIEIIKHVAPLPGRIEGGMHDSEIVHPALQRQSAQPFLVLLIQAFARPIDGALGKFIEAF